MSDYISDKIFELFFISPLILISFIIGVFTLLAIFIVNKIKGKRIKELEERVSELRCLFNKSKNDYEKDKEILFEFLNVKREQTDKIVKRT